jgi:hypothetical protein
MLTVDPMAELRAHRWLLCAEDLLSAMLARDLCDRVIRERAHAQWIRDLWDPLTLPQQREWIGLRPDLWWADRTAVDRVCEERDILIAVRDPETGRRIAPHAKAAMAFKSARVAQQLDSAPSLLVLSGDTDGATDPTLMFAHGVQMASYELPVLCANIHRESEAWLIAGFSAQNTAERDALQALERELGFNPTLHPEKLLSNVSDTVRDAKRVARVLFEPSGGLSTRSERVLSCIHDTPLAVLERNGERAGLATFIQDIERVVANGLLVQKDC